MPTSTSRCSSSTIADEPRCSSDLPTGVDAQSSAQESARELNRDHIDTGHLLLGVLKDGPTGPDPDTSPVLAYLDLAGVDVVVLVEEILETIGRNSEPLDVGHIPFTADSKRALELSLRESLDAGHTYIGTEHILLGLLADEEGVPARLLRRHGVTLELARDALIA